MRTWFSSSERSRTMKMFFRAHRQPKAYEGSPSIKTMLSMISPFQKIGWWLTLSRVASCWKLRPFLMPTQAFQRPCHNSEPAPRILYAKSMKCRFGGQNPSFFGLRVSIRCVMRLSMELLLAKDRV
jgi:hypothetical protein